MKVVSQKADDLFVRNCNLTSKHISFREDDNKQHLLEYNVHMLWEEKKLKVGFLLCGTKYAQGIWPCWMGIYGESYIEDELSKEIRLNID
jgi:hypothetical protein